MKNLLKENCIKHFKKIEVIFKGLNDSQSKLIVSFDTYGGIDTYGQCSTMFDQTKTCNDVYICFGHLGAETNLLVMLLAVFYVPFSVCSCGSVG